VDGSQERSVGPNLPWYFPRACSNIDRRLSRAFSSSVTCVLVIRRIPRPRAGKLRARSRRASNKLQKYSSKVRNPQSGGRERGRISKGGIVNRSRHPDSMLCVLSACGVQKAERKLLALAIRCNWWVYEKQEALSHRAHVQFVVVLTAVRILASLPSQHPSTLLVCVPSRIRTSTSLSLRLVLFESWLTSEPPALLFAHLHHGGPHPHFHSSHPLQSAVEHYYQGPNSGRNPRGEVRGENCGRQHCSAFLGQKKRHGIGMIGRHNPYLTQHGKMAKVVVHMHNLMHRK